jgi:flagellin-like hook-associated protein FlgL
VALFGSGSTFKVDLTIVPTPPSARCRTGSSTRSNNLATFQENLTASESRIRDVDMASQMVTFTKLQIRQQAGTSMLAQANQAPQSVLSLLR